MQQAKRIVAIETSGRLGSVAALLGETNDARLVGQIVLTGDQRTAQSLAPALHDLLAAADWSPKDVELVAVGVGPGSFTGLRIGVTTAKTFAYAVGAEVVGANTLVALAAQASNSTSPLWVILDCAAARTICREIPRGRCNWNQDAERNVHRPARSLAGKFAAGRARDWSGTQTTGGPIARQRCCAARRILATDGGCGGANCLGRISNRTARRCLEACPQLLPAERC